MTTAISSVANLIIVAGYLLMPFTVMRHLPLTRGVYAAASVFFGTCALTHLALAYHFEHATVMTVIHVIQAAAVIWFVLSFSALLRAAVAKNGGEF